MMTMTIALTMAMTMAMSIRWTGKEIQLKDGRVMFECPLSAIVVIGIACQPKYTRENHLAVVVVVVVVVVVAVVLIVVLLSLLLWFVRFSRSCIGFVLVVIIVFFMGNLPLSSPLENVIF
jgi:hypothetical protein